MADLLFPDRLQTAVNNIVVLSTTTNINGKTIATTNSYTVPTGKKCIVIGATIIPTTISGLISVSTLSVGIASGEIDIIPASALTGLIATDKEFYIPALGLVAIGNADDIIKIGITVAAVGTTYTLTVKLIGFIY